MLPFVRALSRTLRPPLPRSLFSTSSFLLPYVRDPLSSPAASDPSPLPPAEKVTGLSLLRVSFVRGSRPTVLSLSLSFSSWGSSTSSPPSGGPTGPHPVHVGRAEGFNGSTGLLFRVPFRPFFDGVGAWGSWRDRRRTDVETRDGKSTLGYRDSGRTGTWGTEEGGTRGDDRRRSPKPRKSGVT